MSKTIIILFLTLYHFKIESVEMHPVYIEDTQTKSDMEIISSIPIQIITEKDIVTNKSTQLLEVLAKHNSVQMIRNGTKLTPSLYGFSPEQILILIDGKRIAMEPMNLFELERISLANVEKIEIITGPISTIYGADALGGVINIITKKNYSEDKISILLKNSNYDLKSGKNTIGVNIIKVMEKHRLVLSSTRATETELMLNKKQTIDGKKNINNDEIKHIFRNNQILIESSFSKSEDQHENLYYNFLNESYVFDLDSNKREQFNVEILFKSKFIDHKGHINVSQYHKRGETFLQNDQTLLMNKIATINLFEAQYSTRIRLSDQLFNLGISHRNENFDGNAFNYKNKSIYKPETNSIFMLNEKMLSEELSVIYSLRYDENKYFMNQLTKQLGFVFNLNYDDSHAIKFNYADAFRAPTPKDLYVDVMIMKGNENLIAEKASRYSIEYNLSKDQIYFKSTTYFSKINDYIYEYYDEALSKYTFKNLSFIKMYGIDNFWKFHNKSYEYFFHHHYLSALDYQKNRLAGRSENTFKFGYLHYTTEKSKIGIDLACVGNEYIYNIDNHLENNSYCTTNLILNTIIKNNIDFTTRIDNLNNKFFYGISQRPRLITFAITTHY